MALCSREETVKALQQGGKRSFISTQHWDSVPHCAPLLLCTPQSRCRGSPHQCLTQFRCLCRAEEQQRGYLGEPIQHISCAQRHLILPLGHSGADAAQRGQTQARTIKKADFSKYKRCQIWPESCSVPSSRILFNLG